ncbi:hypothetical protein B0T17DRAFT_618792 [Bombardia bombarda]|uniref:Uncharacterized protein n=1 Tax=Bombardia bombarda TaxID=252184 RepID=A0AA39WMJ0_9PEZI|nr:hypothetical protein B0T17DRAFT_618792 [Bombardia bombarda]
MAQDNQTLQGAAASNGASSNGASSSASSVPELGSVTSNLTELWLTLLRNNHRGEQTASELEANLSNLETKLDAILASLGVLPDDESSTSEKADQQPSGDEKKKGEKKSDL